jgi:hypothetical protein
MYWLLITALFKFWGLLIFLNYLFRNRLSTFLMKPKNGNWLACVCTFLLALLMNANVLGLGGIALNACIGLSIFGISWTPFGWPARILLALPFWFGWTVWLQQGTEDGVVIVLPILSFVLYSVSLKERASFGAMDRVASGPTV